MTSPPSLPPSPPPSSPPPPSPPSSSSTPYTIEKAMKSLEQANPWIDQAIQQALMAQNTLKQTLDSSIDVARTRLSRIRSTSSAHFHHTLENVKELKGDFDAYEEKFFGKVKEGAVVAASYPLITTGTALGLSFLALKGPRHFLHYRMLRLFSSEEAMLSRADAKVKEMKQSFERLKAESEKLERRVSQAEEEMKRGRTKLRHAGIQIRKAVLSADKIEKQARGLKDILADLPNREASRFRSQISGLVSEAKKERKVLGKEVSKISNYGISI